MIKAGYIVHSELANTNAEDVKKLDVINIAFAGCKDCEFSFENEENLVHIERLKSIKPSVKILFSVGGWGAGGFSIMSSSEENRKKFAKSCLNAVKKYKLDGIDIDWEYPSIDWAGIDASPLDKENFTLMLKEVRELFDSYDKNLMLTIAVGCDSYYIENTQIDKVAPLLDYVSIMTYDMRGCGDKTTGHHTNLYMARQVSLPRSYRSVEHSVKIYNEGGVPLEKIVIGIAFYSRMWKNVEKRENNGLWQKASAGDYGPSYSEIAENYLNKNNFKRYWDDECKAPFLFDGETLISYDDEESIALKCKYAEEKGLAGVMYWEHSCDKTRSLLSAIYNSDTSSDKD